MQWSQFISPSNSNFHTDTHKHIASEAIFRVDGMVVEDKQLTHTLRVRIRQVRVVDQPCQYRQTLRPFHSEVKPMDR